MPDDPVPPKLSLAFVRRIRMPGRYYDRDGLILTVTPSGGKSWSQRITVEGRRRDMGLGSAHLVTPAAARKMAAKNKAVIRAGGNPFVAVPRKRLDSSATSERILTFAAFSANRYRRLRAVDARMETAKEAYSRVRLHANSRIGRLPVAEISPDDVVKLLDVVAEGSRETGRWLRAELVRVFDDAVGEGHRIDNPATAEAVQALPALIPVKVVKHAEGQRILERLPEFLAQIEADHRRPASFILIRFCLLSTRHVKECRLALWSQVDIEAGRWTFPAMQQEGRDLVTVDLTPSLMDLLDRARNFAHGEMQGYVFPSRQGIAEPFNGASLSMSLKRAGYDLTPWHFRRAYGAWTATEPNENDTSLRNWEREIRRHVDIEE